MFFRPAEAQDLSMNSWTASTADNQDQVTNPDQLAVRTRQETAARPPAEPNYGRPTAEVSASADDDAHHGADDCAGIGCEMDELEELAQLTQTHLDEARKIILEAGAGAEADVDAAWLARLLLQKGAAEAPTDSSEEDLLRREEVAQEIVDTTRRAVNDLDAISRDMARFREQMRQGTNQSG